MLGARAQQWAVAFSFMDPAAKVELLCLLSFTVCILGSLSEFPVAVNLGVALLGLVSSRNGGEAQLLAMCFFAALTTVTDIIFMTTQPSGWGGFAILLNFFCKLGAATQAYRQCETSQRLATDELPADPMERGGHAVSHAGLAAPLAREDYQSLASEAAGASRTRTATRSHPLSRPPRPRGGREARARRHGHRSRRRWSEVQADMNGRAGKLEPFGRCSSDSCPLFD